MSVQGKAKKFWDCFKFRTERPGSAVTWNVRWHRKSELTWKVWINCVQYSLNSGSLDHCVWKTYPDVKWSMQWNRKWMWIFMLNFRNRQVKSKRSKQHFMMNPQAQEDMDVKVQGQNNVDLLFQHHGYHILWIFTRRDHCESDILCGGAEKA
jgi:hypothetical protein